MVKEEGRNQAELVSRRPRRREFQEGKAGPSKCNPLRKWIYHQSGRLREAEETGELAATEAKLITPKTHRLISPSGFLFCFLKTT